MGISIKQTMADGDHRPTYRPDDHEGIVPQPKPSCLMAVIDPPLAGRVGRIVEITIRLRNGQVDRRRTKPWTSEKTTHKPTPQNFTNKPTPLILHTNPYHITEKQNTTPHAKHKQTNHIHNQQSQPHQHKRINTTHKQSILPNLKNNNKPTENQKKN